LMTSGGVERREAAMGPNVSTTTKGTWLGRAPSTSAQTLSRCVTSSTTFFRTMFSETRTTTLRTTVTETTHAVLAVWSLAALATALAAVIALWKKARVRPAGALLFAAMLGAPLMVEYVIL